MEFLKDFVVHVVRVRGSGKFKTKVRGFVNGFHLVPHVNVTDRILEADFILGASTNGNRFLDVDFQSRRAAKFSKPRDENVFHVFQVIEVESSIIHICGGCDTRVSGVFEEAVDDISNYTEQ